MHFGSLCIAWHLMFPRSYNAWQLCTLCILRLRACGKWKTNLLFSPDFQKKRPFNMLLPLFYLHMFKVWESVCEWYITSFFYICKVRLTVLTYSYCFNFIACPWNLLIAYSDRRKVPCLKLMMGLQSAFVRMYGIVQHMTWTSACTRVMVHLHKQPSTWLEEMICLRRGIHETTSRGKIIALYESICSSWTNLMKMPWDPWGRKHSAQIWIARDKQLMN